MNAKPKQLIVWGLAFGATASASVAAGGLTVGWGGMSPVLAVGVAFIAGCVAGVVVAFRIESVTEERK